MIMEILFSLSSRLEVYFGNKDYKASVRITSVSDCRDYFETTNTRSGSGYGFNTLYGDIAVPRYEWYHLAFVYNHTKVTIYVNGSFSGDRPRFPSTSSWNANRSFNYFGGVEEVYYPYVYSSI
jgi:hypothetical protein